MVLRPALAEEQAALRPPFRLRGGCTLEAAGEVADADLDTLQSLVEKSLVRFNEGRYWMLETIREYAAERLDEDSAVHNVRSGHAAYYLALAEHTGADDASSVLRRLGDEHDNMRSALSWFEEEHGAESELRLVSALTNFWVVRGHLREGLSHAETALAGQAGESSKWRMKVLAAASDFARLQR